MKLKVIEHYIESELHDLAYKKVIITGSNSGIGFHLADILLKKNARVILACRSKEKAIKAKEKLEQLNPYGIVDIILYDQATYEGMDRLYDEIINHHHDFYALVLNAGVIATKKEKYYDTLPLSIGVNYVSIFYLLEKLQNYLSTEEEEKRIIFQGSLASGLSKFISFNKLRDHGCGVTKSYNLSKLYLHHLFDYYASNNENPNIKYLLAEPGISNTNIIRNFPKWVRKIGAKFMDIFFNNITCSALPSAYLLANIVPNGYYVVPKGVFKIKGLPKAGKFNIKYNEKLIIETREFISGKQ